MMNEGTSDPMDDIDPKLDEMLEILFFCPLCRTTVRIVEWGSESTCSYGAIIMRCRTCGAEVQYYVDEEKTEKAIRDRVLSRGSKKNIARELDEALRSLHAS